MCTLESIFIIFTEPPWDTELFRHIRLRTTLATMVTVNLFLDDTPSVT